MARDIGGLLAARFRWLHSRRLDTLQSGLVLPTARSLYLFGALICVACVVVALFVALLFQINAWRSANQLPVPDAAPPVAAVPTFERVAQRLSGPSGLRLVVDLPQGATLSAGQVFGHFEADSANGLAAFPNDFSIIGGRDANLVDAGFDSRSSHTGLLAKAPLVAAVDKAVKLHKSVGLELRVLARDSAGNRSAETLRFKLGGAAAGTPANAAPASNETPVTDLGGSAGLQQLARRIAAKVSPAGTPAFFDAYKVALGEPGRCGADDDDAFLGTYRKAFGQFGEKLNGDNVDSFYTGLCESWQGALAQTRQSAEQAGAERQRILALNATAVVEAQVRNAASRAVRNAALGFAFSAVIAFMMIALFLAFMAIEGHSAAVRQAIEVLALREARHDEPAAD